MEVTCDGFYKMHADETIHWTQLWLEEILSPLRTFKDTPLK